MVYRRTYRKRNYRRRTKRSYRRRFRKTSRYNKRGQKIYLYKRTADLGTITANNLAFQGYGYDFSLSQVPNFAEFQQLYDQFKINGIKIVFVPQMTENISLGTINNPYANSRMFTCIDYTEATPPGSLNDIREYQSCKWTSILRTHKRYFRPRIIDASATYNPGKPWLSTDTGRGVQHYGIKIGIEPMFSTTTTSMTFRVEAKFYMSFKTVK